MNNLTIALDAMGGDHGPPVTIPAVLEFLSEHPQLHFLICGDKYQIDPFLQKAPKSVHSRIELIHCTQVVSMSEKPTQALRNKPDSSMRLALNAVKDNKADACVSAGNTGALLAMSYLVLKTIPGIHRPALVTAMPSDTGRCYVLDLGANVEVDDHSLYQFALMGSILAEQASDLAKPRVALLNVGEEEIKGSDKIKRTAKMLSDDEHINYVGYVEGSDIFLDKAEVIVCDGFVGNIALKACEGLAKLVVNSIKAAVGQSWLSKFLAALALPALKKIYKRVNPDQYNGASLLGLRGIVVKSHGNASKEALKYAFLRALEEIEGQVPDKIAGRITKLQVTE